MFLSYAMSHLIVTMEALDPTEREGSGKWKMLTMSFTQLGYLVKKWSPSRRTSTVCVTWGGLHISTLALSLHTISKAGHAFSFVRGARVCQISGSSYGP